MSNGYSFQPYVSSFYRTLAQVQAGYDQALRDAGASSGNIGFGQGQGIGGFANGFPTNGISGVALFAATYPGNDLVSRWELMRNGWTPSPSAPDWARGANMCGGCSGNISTF